MTQGEFDRFVLSPPARFDLQAPSKILYPVISPMATGWREVPKPWYGRLWARLWGRPTYDLVPGPEFRTQLLRRMKIPLPVDEFIDKVIKHPNIDGALREWSR